MDDKFQVRYEVDDGYVGKSRPQKFSIDESDIEDDMTEGDLRKFYQEQIDDDFERRIFAFGENEDEFIEWAQKIIKNREDSLDF